MANCKDCLYVEVCKDYAINYLKGTPIEALEEALEKEVGDYPCCRFQDRSLFVKLPCKVGDSVFTIDKKENIQECIVINVNCKTQMMLDEKPWIDFIIVTEPVDDSLPFPMIFTYSITKNYSLFLTRESAEQALKGRENNV